MGGMRHHAKILTILLSGSFALFGVGKAFALTYSSDVGVKFTFNSSLQVNVSADLIISNLSPGTDSDSNIIDVVVKTNNATGYTLNATVGNNTNYNTRNLVHNLSGSSANFASINFGSSLSNLTTDNTWGYSYSTNNGSTWSNYDGLPLYSDETNIATLKTATGPASTNAGDKVNFKIAAKAATSQYSGEYNNVINFVATANPVPTLGPVACESGKICYNANVLDPTEVLGTMGKQTTDDVSGNTITGNMSVMLLASNFSRRGYGFAGWSDTYDYAYNTSANLYGPQEEITTPADMSSGLSLYAIWMPSAGSIQSDANTVCDGLIAATSGLKSIYSISALTDARDDYTYAIAKLADGNCWMIENLRLNNTASHNSDGALAQGYGASNTYGNFSGLANAESSGFTNSNAVNSLYYMGTQSGTASIDIGTSNGPGYRMPRYNNYNIRTRSSDPISNIFPNNTNAGMFSYGNYYTWHAAIADTTYYSSGDHGTTSLCPTNWRLPIGNQSTADSSFGALSVALGGPEGGGAANDSSTPTGTMLSKTFRSYPNNFIYSGSYYQTTTSNRGSSGSYWSSTSNDGINSYSLYMNNSRVSPGTGRNVNTSGLSIRCTMLTGS